MEGANWSHFPFKPLTLNLKPSRLEPGKPILLRPIQPEDEPLMVGFHQTLSDQSVYFRYFHMIGLQQRVDHERLSHICRIDPVREMVLVAEDLDPLTGQPAVVGVGRLNKIPGTPDAEFAILLSDAYQGRGLGSGLLQELIGFGREAGVREIIGEIHPENQAMKAVCRKLGFQITYKLEDRFYLVNLSLRPTAPI